MPLYLLDTNAISDVMSDHPKVVSRIASFAGRVAGSVVAWGEIVDGLARMPAGKRRTRLEGKASLVFALLSWQVVTVPIAEVYGDLKAVLFRHGLNLGDNDLWIAATALGLGMILVTRDLDFHYVPGLLIEDWTQ